MAVTPPRYAEKTTQPRRGLRSNWFPKQTDLNHPASVGCVLTHCAQNIVAKAGCRPY
ncbi:hypothetical protein JB92DRAFT_3043946 [Gautieria morchelliformis]|nr:hypothetical protein JB92DRAFT_3043946 [Gautieria morchelliformis]